LVLSALQARRSGEHPNEIGAPQESLQIHDLKHSFDAFSDPHSKEISSHLTVTNVGGDVGDSTLMVWDEGEERLAHSTLTENR
jgi:hypothetical protein